MSLPVLKCEPTDLLRLHLTYHGNMYFKNGSVRKIDLSNWLKATIDAICEKLGVDDSRLWYLSCEKQHSVKVGIEATIGRIPHGR